MDFPSVIRTLKALLPETYVDASIGNLAEAPPRELVEALHRAAREGKNGYSPGQGVPELVEATASLYTEVSGVHVPPEHVLITAGASSALTLLLLESEKGVLIPDPGFAAYEVMARVLGRKVIYYRLSGPRFQPEEEDVKEKAEHADTIIVASPNNPTSTTLSADSISLIRDIAEDRGLRVILDEPYFSIYFGESGYHSLYRHFPGAEVVSSYGKALAIPGWRVGFLISKRARELSSPHFSLTGGPPTPNQYAIAWIMDRFREYADDLRERLRRKRDYIMSRLAGVEFPVPEGTYFLFARVRGDDFEAAKRAARMGVMLLPGTMFGEGGRGFVRINFSLDFPELDRVAEVVRALQ